MTDFYLPELLAKNSRHMWLMFDSKLSIKLFNLPVVQITGLSKEKLEEANLKVLDSVINTNLSESISNLINEKVNFHDLGSFKISHADINSTFHINAKVYLIFNKGSFDYGILIGEDETIVKNLEQELKIVNQQWNKSESLADLGSWTYDVINDTQKWSVGMYDLHEIDISDKPNSFEDYMKFVHKDDQQIFHKVLESVSKEEKPDLYYDFRIITPSNVLKYIRCTIDVYFEDGTLVKVTGVNQDVSERVSILEKDKEISEIFQIAQRFANTGTWRWSISTNELFWSDNVYEIFGFDKNTDQPDYNNFLGAIPQEDRQRVADALDECIKHNLTYEVEHSIITRSGERKYVLEKGNVLRDSKGQPIEMYGTVTDNTESHQLKLELKFKEERYQLLAESGQEWICLIEATGNIIYSSPAVEFLLGYKESDIIEKNFSTLLGGKDQNDFRNLFKKLIEDPSNQFSIKRKLKAKSGVFIWCEVNLKPLYDSKGNFSIRGLIKDISAQVEYEEKLAESNALLTDANKKYKKINKELQETLVQLEAQTDFLNQINRELAIKRDALNETAIIVESDKNGNIISVNDQFLKIAGYKKSEIIGKPHCIKYKSIFNSGVHDINFFNQIWEKLDNKKVWRGEICNQNKNGGKFWLLKTVIPLLDQHGNIQSFYSFSSDISLQKQKEEELLLSKNATEEAAAVKEEFLSVMSHEIRTPLNSVIGLANLLQRRNPREDQVDMINTLKRSSDNLMHVVNDILDFNKIQSGKILLDNRNFELSDTLNQLESSFREQAAEKGINLIIEKEFDTPLWIKGDINRLFQILNNLIHNALKFTEKGEVKLLVKQQQSNFYDSSIDLEFQLSDTGIGIAKDQLKNLFVPFQQSEKHISRQYGGTGLGLSIVKGLVELLGGTINVESEVQAGTTFFISIPTQKTENIENESKVPEVEDEQKSLENYKILYVEDVPSNQMLIEELLKDCGVKCYLADDGKEAIDLSLKESFDLILMDLQLPKINGFEVTKKIRTQQMGLNLNTPVLAFTAEPSSQELQSRIKSAGLQGCIHKPFKLDDLIEKIKTTIHEQSFKNDKDELFNLDYYKKAFKNNPEKLDRIRELLISDFSSLLKVILSDSSSKDVIREELHRINPIVKNINCNELLDLLDEYKEKMISDENTSTLRNQIRTLLLNIIDSIKTA